MKTEDFLMYCRKSDESVVVIKFRPMKASNGAEGKTGMTMYLVTLGRRRCQKRRRLRREEVQKKITGGL